MSYDEHLISMAGGDGDVLAGIEARIPQIPESAMSRAERDRATLLAMVREQAARLDAVEAVTESLDHSDHCDLYHFYREGGCTCWQRDIVAALKATP